MAVLLAIKNCTRKSDVPYYNPAAANQYTSLRLPPTYTAHAQRSLFHPPVPSYLGIYKKSSLACNKEQIEPTHLTVMLSAAAFSYTGINCVSVLNLCSNTFTF